MNISPVSIIKLNNNNNSAISNLKQNSKANAKANSKVDSNILDSMNLMSVLNKTQISFVGNLTNKTNRIDPFKKIAYRGENLHAIYNNGFLVSVEDDSGNKTIYEPIEGYNREQAYRIKTELDGITHITEYYRNKYGKDIITAYISDYGPLADKRYSIDICSPQSSNTKNSNKNLHFTTSNESECRSIISCFVNLAKIGINQYSDLISY